MIDTNAIAIFNSTTTLAVATSPASSTFGLWPLFVASFDLFTIVLLLGSVFAGAWIFRCVREVRPRAIRDPEQSDALLAHITKGDLKSLKRDTSDDQRVVAVAAFACLERLPMGHDAARDAAELAASHRIGAWFRLLEPLNIIGNLGPLIGLAGTVWGMILAFTQLASGGGEADPSQLSEGISKALFHTLLGLLLAIPCLLVHGLYRTMVERHTDDALADAGHVVEAILAHSETNSVGDQATKPHRPPAGTT